MYDLALNETLDTPVSIDSKDFNVTRVPGGWIYTHVDDTESASLSLGIFVPFSNEFKS